MWRNSESDVKPLEIEEGSSTVYVRRNLEFHEEADRPARWTYEEIEYDKSIYPIIQKMNEQERTIAEQDELLAMLLLGEE